MTTGIYRVALEYEVPNSSKPMNVFWYKNTGTATPTDAALLNMFETWLTDDWCETWKAFGCTTVTAVKAEVDEMYTNGKVERSIGTIVLDVDGDQITEVAPAAVAGYIAAETALPKVRGSKYVPGVGEAKLTAGEFDANALLALANLLVKYLMKLDESLATEHSPGVLSITGGAFVPFTGTGFTESIPAYQRRRKPGRGS